MKVHCVWRDGRILGASVSKDIELACVPPIGAAIEYREGWGLGTTEYLYVGPDYLETGGRIMFSPKELRELIADGWEARPSSLPDDLIALPTPERS